MSLLKNKNKGTTKPPNGIIYLTKIVKMQTSSPCCIFFLNCVVTCDSIDNIEGKKTTFYSECSGSENGTFVNLCVKLSQ